MLLTAGKFAFVAALGLAVGVLIGYAAAPRHGDADTLVRALATSTPAPVCGQPSDRDKLIIGVALNDRHVGRWATSDDVDTIYIAAVTSKGDRVMFSRSVDDPRVFHAVNAAARRLTPLAAGEASDIGDEALACVGR